MKHSKCHRRSKKILQSTDSAKDYLRQVGKPNVYLSVKGGGCSGFQYVWDVTDETPTVENLVIDPMQKCLLWVVP